MTVKKCTKTCAARAKLLFCLVSLFLCWRFCRRRKFWMTVERRDEKIIRGQLFKRWRVLSTWKITIQSVMQLFSPIINPSPGPMLFNQGGLNSLTLIIHIFHLSFWKCRDLEDPLDHKDLEDHVVNRYCKPIHYLWYIFLSPAAWLDAEGGGNTRSFLSCSKPSFSFFEGVARRSVTLRIIPILYFRYLRSICIWWQI